MSDTKAKAKKLAEFYRDKFGTNIRALIASANSNIVSSPYSRCSNAFLTEFWREIDKLYPP